MPLCVCFPNKAGKKSSNDLNPKWENGVDFYPGGVHFRVVRFRMFGSEWVVSECLAQSDHFRLFKGNLYF